MSFWSAGAFAKLIRGLRAGLKKIAWKSNGETTVEDLESEAWMIADKLRQGRVPPPDPGDKSFHQEVFFRLWRKFLGHGGKSVRYARSLDEEGVGDDGVYENPILAKLRADDCSDPLEELVAREELKLSQAHEQWSLTQRFSEAIAYVHVLDRFQQDCAALASHLAIATCTLRRRMHRAAELVDMQPSLFDGIESVPDLCVPRSLLAARRRMARSDRRKCLREAACGQLRLFARLMIPIRLVAIARHANGGASG